MLTRKRKLQARQSHLEECVDFIMLTRKRELQARQSHLEECVVCKEEFDRADLHTLVDGCKHPMCIVCLRSIPNARCDLCCKNWPSVITHHDHRTCKRKCGESFSFWTYGGKRLLSTQGNPFYTSTGLPAMPPSGAIDCIREEFGYDPDEFFKQRARDYFRSSGTLIETAADADTWFIYIDGLDLNQRYSANVAIVSRGSWYLFRFFNVDRFEIKSASTEPLSEKKIDFPSLNAVRQKMIDLQLFTF